jgi:FAD-dependent oxidoreductase
LSSTREHTIDDGDPTTCKWDRRLAPHNIFYHHTAVAIPMARVPALVRDVKRLRERAGRAGMCMLNMFGGIHVRFVGASTAYLGERSDSAMFELVYYRAHEKGTPRLHEDLMEEIEQMMVVKYGGKPHWGKNRAIAFTAGGGPRSRVADLDAFLAVKDELDPDDLFSSEWSDELLGLAPPAATAAPFCALDGLCVCSEDAHCAPHAGYTCQRGLVFEAARVCRLQTPAARMDSVNSTAFV